MRLVLLALTLFAYWLMLSGHYDTWLVASGAVLSGAVVWFCWFKGVTDKEGFPIGLTLRGLVYWPWLLWQILLSGLNVTRLILNPALPISPTLAKVDAQQKTAVGLVTYANSITLTPGTIAIEASEKGRCIWIHAIEKSGADGFADDEMNRRVAWFEGEPWPMFLIAIVAVLGALGLAVARALMGPTAFDRLLAANTIGTFAIMLLALYGFLTDRPEFLDLGITYALLNMIGTLAVLKFFRYGALGHDHRHSETEHKG